jgi:hypothetical protein
MDLQRLFRYTTIKKRGYNVMISKEGGFACCLRVAASSNKANHGEGYYIVASPPFRSRVC